MTYKIGTVGEFMAWTHQVIRDPALAWIFAKGIVPLIWTGSYWR